MSDTTESRRVITKIIEPWLPGKAVLAAFDRGDPSVVFHAIILPDGPSPAPIRQHSGFLASEFRQADLLFSYS
jgi:hypothetical protein